MNLLRKVTRQATIFTICKIVLIASLSGCSDEPTGGISGTGKAGTTLNTGIIVGQLDSIDRLTIDGQTFDATASEVLINGNPATLDQLRVGMSVTAKVDYQEQQATSIYYQPLLAGPIDATSDDKSIVEILGQTISITNDTYLDELTSEDIFQDNIIEISGNRGKSGLIIAEYIRVPDLTNSFFVVGDLVENPDSPDEVSIGGTSVDLDNLNPDENGQTTELPTGSTVKAELEEPVADSTPDTPLVVTNAEVVPEHKPAKYEKVSIHGVVTEVFEGGKFEVRKYNFTVSDETEFRDRTGNITTPVPITEDTKVKVDGISTGTDWIDATVITIRN